MADDLEFVATPFQPGEALQRLKRDLRALGLVERDGRFERRGLAVARAAVQGATLSAARVKQPRRTGCEWITRVLHNNADVRDFLADLKKHLPLWSDRDD